MGTRAYEDAAALDAADPLAGYRERFHVLDDPVAYLDGNSLGRPPRETLRRVGEVLEREWGGRLIRSWDEDWGDLAERVGDRLASACLGAGPGQTTIADSTSVNLYKVLRAACALLPDRDEIVVEEANFPTDRYLAESVARECGLRVRTVPATTGTAGVDPDTLATVLGSRTALVLLSHVDYSSGALLDLAALTAQIHQAGALAVWDLCHSAGVVPVGLDEAAVDFAVGCTYKYLNAGPGAPAFLYVAARHLPDVRQPIPGWWGAEDTFAMAAEYAPAPTIRRMLSGTPNVLGITAVDEGVRLTADAGIEAIRAKAALLTGMCIELADEWLVPAGFEVASPRDAAARGGHVSLRHPDARELTAALFERGVVPDFRNPGLIRLGLAPLTTSYAELWTAMDILREIA